MNNNAQVISTINKTVANGTPSGVNEENNSSEEVLGDNEFYVWKILGGITTPQIEESALEDFMKPTDTEEQRKAFLLEIDYFMLNLHRSNLPWPHLSPSNILLRKTERNGSILNIKSLANIYCFVLDKENLYKKVLPFFATDTTLAQIKSQITSVEDIYRFALTKKSFSEKCSFFIGSGESLNGIKDNFKSLADIYCYALANENVLEGDLPFSDPHIALDLVEKIAKDEISMEDVLNHPFHWSNDKKITYICQAHDIVKRWKDKDDINVGNDDVIPAGWTKLLKLKREELEYMEAQHEEQQAARPSQSYKPFSADLIYNLTNKYGKNISDLMGFLRNNYAHYWQSPSDVRAAFGSYSDGYWKFFSGRYPKFFMYVYNKMEPIMRNNEVDDIHMIQNPNLPSISIKVRKPANTQV